MTERIFLTRRNLQTLLNKLDRTAKDDPSACTILKLDNQHPVYPQTMSCCIVSAVEDDEYYIDRDPGVVHHKDCP